MTDSLASPPWSAAFGEDDAGDGWQRVILWLPRIVLCDTRMGLRRRLLLPGVHRVRMSRRLNRPVYRR